MTHIEHSGTVDLPQRMRALILDGVGFEHLQVRSVPVPTPGPEQLLARVDAAGICTSLIKLVEQGPDHPYLYGWDLARHPLILGDEGSVTLVQVGQGLRDRYRVGERYVIQPAVGHPPINHRDRYRGDGRGVDKLAVGYTLPGHLAEYVLVTEEVLQAQCLRPIADPALPYSHAALCEPLSCVISAQDHHVHLLQEDGTSPRRAAKGLKPDGVVLIIGAGAMGRMHVDLALSSRPRSVVVADVSGQRLKLVSQHFSQRAADLNVPLHTVNPSEEALAEVIEHVSHGRGADDVIVAAASKQAIESAQHLVARGGVLNLFAGLKAGADIIALSTGVAHYREAIVTGSSGGSPWDIDMTLQLMINGSLDPATHIAQVGDLEHAIGFLNLVKSNEIEGKAMVYPHRPASQPRSVATWTAKDEQRYLEPCGSPQPCRATSLKGARA